MKEDNAESLYERLKLQRTCSFDEIKQAFRTLAKEYHPDSSAETAGATQFHYIRTAYETLIDPDLRKIYDQSCRDALDKKTKDAITKRLFTIDLGTKLEIILAWSTTKPSFNISFASSCLNCMAEGTELTNKQISCIDNIITQFKIDLDKWLDDSLRYDCLNRLMATRECQEYDSKSPWSDL